VLEGKVKDEDRTCQSTRTKPGQQPWLGLWLLLRGGGALRQPEGRHAPTQVHEPRQQRQLALVARGQHMKRAEMCVGAHTLSSPRVPCQVGAARPATAGAAVAGSTAVTLVVANRAPFAATRAGGRTATGQVAEVVVAAVAAAGAVVVVVVVVGALADEVVEGDTVATVIGSLRRFGHQQRFSATDSGWASQRRARLSVADHL
jgi:hypothetical protein